MKAGCDPESIKMFTVESENVYYVISRLKKIINHYSLLNMIISHLRDFH